MCLKIIEGLFILAALLLTLLMLVRECGITKKMSPMKASDFVSSIALFVFLYVFFALLLVFILPGLHNKLIMVIFAISPFVIGKLVTYQTVKLYSFIQILCIVISAVYAIIV